MIAWAGGGDGCGVWFESVGLEVGGTVRLGAGPSLVVGLIVGTFFGPAEAVPLLQGLG